jgi:alpha-maltose-1-phosphate synthase
VRLLLVNENIGGHGTVHLHLERALREIDGVEADFLHVPAPRGIRHLAGVAIPGLAPLDLDLKPLRAQLALSAWVRRRLRRHAGSYDALHVYTHNAALLSQDVLRARPSVVVLDATNAQNAYRLPYRRPTSFTPRVLPLTQAFERRVYDAATLVVPSSAWAAASLRADYGIPDERVRVVPMGLAAPEPAAMPDPPPEDGLPRLLFVGRSLERKGGNLLLRLHREHLVGRCILTLVTPEPVPAHEGVEVVSDLTPGDPRLWQLLRRSRAFVFPSEMDMAPNAVLEAMAAGTAVVAARAGAVPEMLDDGAAGLLVDPGDERGLLGAIESLLDRPDHGAALGAAGRSRFEERYDARVTARRLVGVVEEAIELHRSRA